MKELFKGVGTALITPMSEGEIDFYSYEKLIEYQLESKVDALIINGTTGEGCTLSFLERNKCVEFAVKKVDGKIPVIAGTGSNDYNYAVRLTKSACDLGADGVLVVTPYYNKATQAGLIKYYAGIADNSTVPLILYNVPSRTGVNVEPDTYRVLSKHKNIVGYKEANGDISKIMKTTALTGKNFALYSGNDDQTLPLLSIGGKGVISVVSNVLPKVVKKMCDSYFCGAREESLHIQKELIPLVNLLFCEVNPIPIKQAMSHLQMCKNELRLPLTEMTKKSAKKLCTLIDKYRTYL